MEDEEGRTLKSSSTPERFFESRRVFLARVTNKSFSFGGWSLGETARWRQNEEGRLTNGDCEWRILETALKGRAGDSLEGHWEGT